MINMSKKLIEPIKRRCGCGKRVIHHHKYCDKCWKKKEKIKFNRMK
jgi:hypothetical protein